MKKFTILVLAMVMVMGMSAVSFAADATADVDVNVTIDPYMEVWFTDKGDLDYDGLFGGAISGEPGIYISDGNTTKNSVLANNYWGGIGASEADVISDYNTGESEKYVELFTVDANTDVDVTLSANWDNWLNAPTIFRVSSNNPKVNPDSNNPDVNGIGDWSVDLAMIGNNVQNVYNEVDEEYNDIIDDHNALTTEGIFEDTFPLDFGKEDEDDGLVCHGPLDFHVNAALWLPKASQVAAGEYSAIVTVTVAAANGSDA